MIFAYTHELVMEEIKTHTRRVVGLDGEKFVTAAPSACSCFCSWLMLSQGP